VIPPVTPPVVPDVNGSVNVEVSVKNSSGSEVAVTDIIDQELIKKLGTDLQAAIVDGKVVISGTAEYIGTVALDVKVAGGETTTLTFTVEPIELDDTEVIETTPIDWTGTLVETLEPDGTTKCSFAVYVPLYLRGNEVETAIKTDYASALIRPIGEMPARVIRAGDKPQATAKASLGTPANNYHRASFEPLAYMEITGSSPGSGREIVVESVSYTVGIYRYSKSVNMNISDTSVEYSQVSDDGDNVSDDGDSVISDSGDGGGCDSGFGVVGGMTLLALGIALAAKSGKLRSDKR
jgi:hypothetical protein